MAGYRVIYHTDALHHYTLPGDWHSTMTQIRRIIILTSLTTCHSQVCHQLNITDDKILQCEDLSSYRDLQSALHHSYFMQLDADRWFKSHWMTTDQYLAPGYILYEIWFIKKMHKIKVHVWWRQFTLSRLAPISHGCERSLTSSCYFRHCDNATRYDRAFHFRFWNW